MRVNSHQADITRDNSDCERYAIVVTCHYVDDALPWIEPDLPMAHARKQAYPEYGQLIYRLVWSSRLRQMDLTDCVPGVWGTVRCAAGGIYHALNRENACSKIFREDADAMERKRGDGLGRCSHRIVSYQLMPNHSHIVRQPTADCGTSCNTAGTRPSEVTHGTCISS